MDSFKKQSKLEPYFEKSYGFAVFSSIAKAGIVFIGGAGGRGDVYIKGENNEEKRVGTVDMIHANVGWTLGGAVYQEIIFFETEKDFKDFTSGHFEFSADAGAVALTAAATTKATTMGNQGPQYGLTPDMTEISGPDAATYRKGTAVFTLTLGGFMYQATVGGQQFSYNPIES